MKIQLDEKTLNAYINEAMRQELNEGFFDLFGADTRRQSRRMITGQGWGNQKRSQANSWGGANSDIRDTDSDEVVPQTLVGMIKKMEKGLVTIEQTMGLPAEYEGLGEKVAAFRNGGGFKMKQSLLNAINALSRLADRLNAVERQSGSNAIMESVNEYNMSVPMNGTPSVSTTLMGAGNGTAKAAAGAQKASEVATNAQKLKYTKPVAKNIGKIGKVAKFGGMAALLLTIADEAARQGAQARQRKIVRTYNCASVLAKRMANILNDIEAAQGGNGEQDQLDEINVRRARMSFDSIERGMSDLSDIMKRINAQLNGQPEVQMPESLNTRQEIKQFQEWANANGYKDERGVELNPDGIWGRHTDFVYNQIAQEAGQIQESVIKEGTAVMNALNSLESKVGVTGAGGRAYSDISRMSGAKDGSRSQGARASKFIIRTYPQVLNQYLGVLSSAGANVAGIQPLRVDTRTNRDYDVSEIQAIDQRIKDLLSIAQNLKTVQPKQQEVNLPPKPVVKPVVKKPAQPQQQQEPQKKIEPLPTPKPELNLNKLTKVVANPKVGSDKIAQMKPELAGGRPGPSNASRAILTMAGIGNDDESSLGQKKRAINTVARGVNKSNMPSWDKSLVNNAKKTIKTNLKNEPVNEETFKKLVKNTITEILKK